MIHQFLDHLYAPANGRNGLLADVVLWRTVWRIVMEFYCLGRFSDVSGLRRSDIRFEQQPQFHLVVHFEGGKNDKVNIRLSYLAALGTCLLSDSQFYEASFRTP